MTDVLVESYPYPAFTTEYATTIEGLKNAANINALTGIFANLAYGQGHVDVMSAHAATLRQNDVPFNSEIIKRISGLDIAAPEQLQPPETAAVIAPPTQIFKSCLKAMGYGGLPVRIDVLEATAGSVGWTMQDVRLELVPSPRDFALLAAEQGRTLAYTERAELSANARRTLIRCGGSRYFNQLLMRLANPKLVAQNFVDGLANTVQVTPLEVASVIN